jgi:hypothetical protein
MAFSRIRIDSPLLILHQVMKAPLPAQPHSVE